MTAEQFEKANKILKQIEGASVGLERDLLCASDSIEIAKNKIKLKNVTTYPAPNQTKHLTSSAIATESQGAGYKAPDLKPTMRPFHRG